MSEEEGLEPTTHDETPVQDEDRTVEDLKAEVARLRREAAGRRVASKESRAEAESAKSELQQALDRLNKLETDLAAERTDRMRLEAAKKAGLDLDLADRIRGTSEDEMLEDAKTLVERFGKSTKRSPGSQAFSGANGQPVRAEESTSTQFSKWLLNS